MVVKGCGGAAVISMAPISTLTEPVGTDQYRGPQEYGWAARSPPATTTPESSSAMGLAVRNRRGSLQSPSASLETANSGFLAEVVNYAWNLGKTGTGPDALREALCEPLGGEKLVEIKLAPREEPCYETVLEKQVLGQY